jgi:hypothetical protein
MWTISGSQVVTVVVAERRRVESESRGLFVGRGGSKSVSRANDTLEIKSSQLPAQQQILLYSIGCLD